jgi:hypothetical protein
MRDFHVPVFGRQLTIVLFTVVAFAALALAAGGAEANRYVEIKGGKAPGPKKFDKVWVEKRGPRKADTVLVLIPGTSGGAGSVSPIARDLSRKVDGL